jgi:DNA-binding transcriptional ArsR family regulator
LRCSFITRSGFCLPRLAARNIHITFNIYRIIYIFTRQKYLMLKSAFNPPEMERASDMLKALAHPIRLAIVELLADRKSSTVRQIQESLGLEQAVVSQQLAILKSRNVLICEREGKNSVYSLKYLCLKRIVDCLKQCNS